MLDPLMLTHHTDYTRPAQAAMAVVSKLQQFRSEDQVLGAALVFVKLCDHYGVRPVAALEAAAKMFAIESPGSMELRAFAQYIEKEIVR